MNFMAIILGIFGFIQFIRRANNRRIQWQLERQLANSELTPNCLINRNPMVAVVQRAGFWRPSLPWNQLIKYLTEHGFDIRLIFVDSPEEVPNVIASLRRPAHIWTEARGLDEIREQIGRIQKSILSLTSFENENSAKQHLVLGRDLYRLSLQKPFDIHHRMREHCVNLAERDFLSEPTAEQTQAPATEFSATI
jgi:hypothetical protein